MILTAKQMAFFKGTTMADLKTAQMFLDDLIPSHEELRAEKDALALSEARVREAVKKGSDMWERVAARARSRLDEELEKICRENADYFYDAESTPPSSPVQVAQAMREVCEAAKEFKHSPNHQADRHREDNLFRKVSALEALEGE
jgi:hypothetical protein